MTKCKVIAVANQKGGVGKAPAYTRAYHERQKIMAVDVDPQSDLTKMLGQQKSYEMKNSLSTAMNAVFCAVQMYEHPEIMNHHEDFDFVPANRTLSAVEVWLVNEISRETNIDTVKHDYDYVLLDCRPSHQHVQFNAVTLAIPPV